MNMPAKFEVKKIFLTIALFFVLFLVLAGLSFLLKPNADLEMKRSANTVIHSWNEKAAGLGDKTVSSGIGGAYQMYMTDGKNNKEDRIFIVRITGNAGPFTGIFYYKPTTGTVFCGLAGVSDNGKNEQQFGMTQRIISMWLKKLDVVANKSGEKK